MTIYSVRHRTAYHYEEPVVLGHNEIHLCPRSLAWQVCWHHEVHLTPPPASYAEREDFFGNRVAYFALQEAHRTLEIMATSHVRIVPRTPPPLEDSMHWEEVREVLRHGTHPELLEAYQFAFTSPRIAPHPLLLEYAQRAFPPGRPVLAATMELMRYLYKEFQFDPKATTVTTPLAQVLEKRRGVCQDFAHLMIGCLRALGLAARYVSGYLETLPPPNRPKLAGSDVSHAWCSVFCPGHGWIDFDPTNNQIPSDQHITLAWGRDYSDITPLKGIIYGGGTHTLQVAVDVLRMPTNTPTV